MRKPEETRVNGEKKRVAIIGGGITGLTVAFYLQKEMEAKGLPIEYKLYESSERLGGKIQTDYTDGFVIEKGPDSFLERKQSAARLAKAVGLEKELLNNDTGQAYILKEKKLFPIPGGSVMGIPTELTPFATTTLFSPIGKVRAAADLILPRRSNATEDQSLGTFFRHRLGDEVVDYLIEPLLSGIYAGDIDKLSLMATFPQFHQVEQKYRSLILGMKKGKTKQPNTGKKAGMFLSLKGGLQSLVDAIEYHLKTDAVEKNTSVQHLKKNDNDTYDLQLADGRTETFDYVVLTTPHQVSLSLLSQYNVMDSFEDMPSTSVATVAMAFPESAIKEDLDGTGFVVSKKGDYDITACTWTHKKWRHTAPEGYALLRCYVGRFGDEAIVFEQDDEIVKKVLRDLTSIIKVEGEPLFYQITRWENAMPQYIVGHKERVEKAKKTVQETLPGVVITGASYEGLGIPDCIDQGEAVVRDLVARFT